MTGQLSKVQYEFESVRRREVEDSKRGVDHLQGRLQEVEARLNKSVMDNERLATENRNLSGRLSELDRIKGSNR